MMLRRIQVTALACLAATSVAAETLPISGAYGTDMGCAVYAERDALGDVESILYVTPEMIVGFEYACSIDSVMVPSVPTNETAVFAMCSAAGDAEGEAEPALIGIFEDAAARTLSYSGGGTKLVLHRCD